MMARGLSEGQSDSQRLRGDTHPVLFVDDPDVVPLFSVLNSGFNLAAMAGEHPIAAGEVTDDQHIEIRR